MRLKCVYTDNSLFYENRTLSKAFSWDGHYGSFFDGRLFTISFPGASATRRTPAGQFNGIQRAASEHLSVQPAGTGRPPYAGRRG